jgi:hypothetical protein
MACILARDAANASPRRGVALLGTAGVTDRTGELTLCSSPVHGMHVARVEAEPMKKLVVPLAIAAGVTLAGAGSLAFASSRNQPAPVVDAAASLPATTLAPATTAGDGHDHDHDMANMDMGGIDMGGMDMGGTDTGGTDAGGASNHGAAGHQHTLPPLAERERQATAEERAAADRLVADTKAAVAPYQDIENARAGGFVPNRSQVDNITVHYPQPANRRDDHQLDPAHPEGLMYRHNADGTSTLLAVVYTVNAGEPAPTPAGPIFSWHTHQDCADFFIQPGECPDTFRMLHVWIADGVVDPFAGTFREAMGAAPR